MAENKNTKKSSAKSSPKTTEKKTTNKNNVTKKEASKKVTTKKVETKAEKKVEVKPVEKVEVKKEEKVEAKKDNNNLIEIIKQNITLIVLCLICILLIINIILVVNGHKAKLENGKEIIASIEDKTITAEDLFDSLKEKYGTKVLMDMIDQDIISKEVTDNDEMLKKAKEQVSSIKSQYEAMGYKWEEVLTSYGYENEQVLIDEINDSLLKEEVVNKYLSNTITDDEINKYYNENINDSFTAKHILIIPDTTDTMTDEEKAAQEEIAKNKALEVITKLNNGEAWANLVTAYSQDTGSKENEGLIENFTKGDVVDEFYEATEKLNDGAYTTEPVKSKYGYHIILRVSKTEKEALESMKEELIDKIVSSKLNEDSNLYTTTWAKIRDTYKLEINDTTIKSNYDKTIKGE